MSRTALPSTGWRCFHCNEFFAPTATGERAAREHFGPTPDWDSACIERRTLGDDWLLELARAARLHERAMLDRALAAEEAEEIALCRIDGARQTERVNTVWERNRAEAAELQLGHVRRHNPVAWRAAWDAVVGGEPYPLREEMTTA